MARLQVRVKPNARKNDVLSQEGSTMTVAVAAPPEKGKANLELIRFLSKKLKKQVRIVSGFGNSSKILEITDK
ncbi:MAG: DUF167 domain-containing protein [Candidatus Woesearchaeota archaeon]